MGSTQILIAELPVTHWAHGGLATKHPKDHTAARGGGGEACIPECVGIWSLLPSNSLTWHFPQCVLWTISTTNNNSYRKNKRVSPLSQTELVEEHRSLYCRTSQHLSCDNVPGKSPSGKVRGRVYWTQDCFCFPEYLLGLEYGKKNFERKHRSDTQS